MKLIFKTKRNEMGDISSFYFSPIEPLSWVAGQSIKLELPAGYGTEERRFTISSAPYTKVIRITTRISKSKFKLALEALAPGTIVTAYSIEGTFTWRESSKPKLLCASGMGITPYISMLEQRKHEKKSLNATLLYADRSPTLLFDKYLHQLQLTNPELKLVPLPEQRLNSKIILEHYDQGIVYISGPSIMVDDISSQLFSSGLSEDDLKRDWFTGRPGWDMS